MKLNKFICHHCNCEIKRVKQEHYGRCNFTEYSETILTDLIPDITEETNEDDIYDMLTSCDYDTEVFDTQYEDYDGSDSSFYCPECEGQLDMELLVERSLGKCKDKSIEFLLKKK